MALCKIESSQANESALFDRETLQFTVKLLKPHNPSLALRIQNLIAPTSTIYQKENAGPSPNDRYQLTLDSFTLRRVVDTLATAGQELAEKALQTHDGDHDFLIHTKSAIGKWLDYARYHQTEFNRLSSREAP